ncbi:MAG: hypothetical protein HY319_05310 [Armatimonadetes bacterium]|nr:hypothetical protein [Armatimonadota bacterium]
MEKNQLIGVVLLATGAVDMILAPLLALRVADPIKRLVVLMGMGMSGVTMAGLGAAFWLGYL